MASFAESIKRNSETIMSNVAHQCELIAKDLFTEAVNYSPTKPPLKSLEAKYAKGHFINNWMVGINSFNTSTTSATDVRGGQSLAQISTISVSIFFKKDGMVSLSNSLDYARNIEYLGWPKTSGETWTGRVSPYAPVRKAFIYTMPKYKFL